MNTLIIAEAGVNHNGDFRLAERLIEEAASSGVDIIKFQTFVPENVISKYAEKAEYQKEETGFQESQLEMVKKLYLPLCKFQELKKKADSCNIQFMSTPFDFESIGALKTIDMPFWKIPSGEINNLPYLIRVAKLNKKVILSTGMSTMQEIENAVEILRKNGTEKITLLHCTTEYPAPYSDVNLKAMLSIKEHFNLPVGYSDHTAGIEVALAAAALGAAVIEKHFTLDKNMVGPDHKASLAPQELREMVAGIRNIAQALGDGKKTVSESEKKNIIIARKSIVAKINIKKGELFTEENLTVKRPGNGISPMKWFDMLGKTAGKDFYEDELINEE